jgi:hypothetical protein
MSSYYEIDELVLFPLKTVNSQSLNEFFSKREHSIAFSSIDLSEVATYELNFTNRIESESGVHMIWICQVEVKFNSHDSKVFETVVKFKKLGGSLYSMSEKHALSMHHNCEKVSHIISQYQFGDIRTTTYFVLRVADFYIWLEEKLEKFQKFLAHPLHENINKRLSISSSTRVERLQAAMLANGESPIIDAQGGLVICYDADGKVLNDAKSKPISQIVLSSIETANSLSKFAKIDSSECTAIVRNHVTEKYPEFKSTSCNLI